MIIKSMARKQPSFRQLIAYLHKQESERRVGLRPPPIQIYARPRIHPKPLRRPRRSRGDNHGV